MRFSIQPTHPPLKTLGVTKFFFFVNHPTQVSLETEQLQKAYHDNLIRPKWKYYNQNNKILHPRFTHDTPSCSIDRYDKAMTKFQCALWVVIPVIVHENNIRQTDDHQSACELFRSCSYFKHLQDFKHLILVSLYFHSREPLKRSTRH